MTDSHNPESPPDNSVVELSVAGVSYKLHVPDAATDYIQKMLVTTREPYERDMLEDMRSRLAPGDCVVDVGANIGNHSLYLAAVAGCTVHAFEPNTHLHDALCRSVDLNALGARVSVHKLGLGDGAANARFERDVPENLGAQRLLLGDGDVEVVTLDSLVLAGPIKAMKIDVEGMELQVLRGAEQLLKRDRPMIYVECAEERDQRVLVQWLEARGYVYWDLFNATPTHLLLPAETLGLAQQLSRLQMRTVQEQQRNGVRLRRAYTGEREAQKQMVGLKGQLALQLAEIESLKQAAARAQTEFEAGVRQRQRTQKVIDERLAELMGERTRLQGEVQSLTARHAALAQEMDARVRQLTAKVRASDEQLAQAEARLVELRTELDRLHSVQLLHRQASHERDRLRHELSESRIESLRLTDELQAETDRGHAMQLQQQQALSERGRLRSEVQELRGETARLTESLADERLRLGDLEELLDAERRRWSSDAAELLARDRQLANELDRSQRDALALAGKFGKAQQRLDHTRQSASFKVGAALVQATRSLPAVLALPATLWHIYRDTQARRNDSPPAAASNPGRVEQETAARVTALSTPAAKARPAAADSAPARKAAAKAAPAAQAQKAKAVRPAADTARVASATDASPAQSARRPARVSSDGLTQLRVACIVDDFTFHSFAPECRLLPLRPESWRDQVEDFRPDILFIESAWNGVDGSWQRKVSSASEEVLALIEWARLQGVPSAFWCKEDPVHFARFLPVARRVDHVFTTDIDCIAKYKDALKHDRVHLLPFAAQPAMHNPVQTVPRQDAFCFAGSYYPHYPQRQTDFAALVGVGRKLRRVDIFDRNADLPLPHDFVFPAEYQAEIRGTLPYAEMDRAYKGYRYGITVNTIKQSQTMFARRAFELMACNTVVVSNFAKGLRLLFGDLVIASDSAVELENRLAPLCGDDSRYRQHRLLALRSVMLHHTCAHRLSYLAGKLTGRQMPVRLPRVAMLAWPANEREAQGLIRAFERQTMPGCRLVLLGAGAAGITTLDRVSRFADSAEWLAQRELPEWVAPVCASDFHGPDYLLDMALATRYSKADAFTKGARFVVLADGSLRLDNAELAYTAVPTAALRCSLVRMDVLRTNLAKGTLDIAAGQLSADQVLSLDEFNFAWDAEARGAKTAAACALPPVRSGVDFTDELLPIAEGVRVSLQGAVDDDPITLDAAEAFALLQPDADPRLTFSLGDEGQIRIVSTLPLEEHKYVYLSRRFTPAELKGDREGMFQWESDARFDVKTVFVFQDKKSQKLGHAMHPVGALYPLPVPAGTQRVRLALRVQGSGQASLGRLTLGQLRGLPVPVIPSGRHLVVATQYPSYDDLYRFGFVHARLRAYLRAGIATDMMRLRSDNRMSFREFEGIEVCEADRARLDEVLATRRHETVMVHILEERTWAVLRQHLDTVKLVIWVHGAEIQPWWRREFSHESDAQRERARRSSDVRFAMWREIFSLRHPNLTLVFVSRKQLSEALGDVGVHAKDAPRIEVISNYIDTVTFPYTPRRPAHRLRILSIRSFASPKYANDLSVAAILHLADQPCFENLHFTLVGDGPLFESTVAPIRHLPNVELIQGFLTHQQIAVLQQDYGVFLVPTRWDSQGVSRDEAMASGLVPVTTRISAVPEFVDTGCAFLAEPEDPVGLANAIRRLHDDPELFQRMSHAASRRVREQTGYMQTVGRELALIEGVAPEPTIAADLQKVDDECMHIAIYGDLNLNIMDGSAIWAASLAETLGGASRIRVTLLLKSRVQRTVVISRLLDMAPEVRLVESNAVDRRADLTPAEAVQRLAELDRQTPFRAIVVRTLNVCAAAAANPRLQGRLWTYLTDIPQRAEEMDDASRMTIARIIEHSEFMLCQTPQFETYLAAMFPQAQGKTRILSPMIPRLPSFTPVQPSAGGPFRLCYAGKFAPSWGIAELFRSFDALRAQHPTAELHVYGDKIHNVADQPEFRASVSERLSSTAGLVWHGAVNREALMRELSAMDVCWAFRDPEFERGTLELSTKILEFAYLGVPIILARSPVNEGVFGADYPLFAADEAQALHLLQCLLADIELRRRVQVLLSTIASRFTFDAVRASLVTEGVLLSSSPAEAPQPNRHALG